MAFQQGLSGLNASSKALDVTSNNIANASTVGFKGAATHFADVYAASLSGGGASQVGIGVSASAIVQQYTQGNITTTSNSLDIAINGNGFFRMLADKEAGLTPLMQQFFDAAQSVAANPSSISARQSMPAAPPVPPKEGKIFAG